MLIPQTKQDGLQKAQTHSVSLMSLILILHRFIRCITHYSCRAEQMRRKNFWLVSFFFFNVCGVCQREKMNRQLIKYISICFMYGWLGCTGHGYRFQREEHSPKQPFLSEQKIHFSYLQRVQGIEQGFLCVVL